MADTFVGTSNFGNTNITGKLAVTEKIEAKDGSIAESSKEVRNWRSTLYCKNSFRSSR